MFKDKMKLSEEVSAAVAGPEVQPEKIIGPVVTTMMPHTDGCSGCMYVYYDTQSREVRAKCDECGSAYMLARTENGFFKRG